MAGLPCEVCQEEALVIPTARVIEDATGRMVYHRYRTCTNPDCDLYLVRRNTLEVFVPLEPDAPFVPPSNSNLKKLALPRRTAPFPLELVPEEIRRAHKSQPSITDEESKVLELARYLGQIHLADVQSRLSCTTVKAQKLLNTLTSLGILVHSPAYRCYEPVPADEIPSHIRLPEHLQRSVS